MWEGKVAFGGFAMPQSAVVSQPQVVAETARSPKAARYLPREHGATAMLITPIVCAAILARTWRWAELATLAAAFSALAIKDPLVVLARQRFVWKQRHPETAAAIRWFIGWVVVLAVSGLVLLFAWPVKATAAMALGVAVFSLLAVFVNLKNRQRSTLYQIASAAALTSTSLATSLSAAGTIKPWCWWLWLFLALQATAGILVVHARLDARIALRSARPSGNEFRRAAQISLLVLAAVAIAAATRGLIFICAAFAAAAAFYAYDLYAQRNPAALQLPLSSVGRRALALSSIYSVLLILGLW
jgi:hypothetical protein